MNNLVSVVIPSLNRFDYLLNAVKSVENQTYKNYEIIIVNDGSDDQRYYDHNFSEKIKIINLNRSEEKEIKGPGDVRNYGISEARGKYIAFLDDDDIWMEEKLELQLKTMEEKEFKFSSTEGYFGEGIYNPNKKYPLYNKEKFFKKIKSKYKKTNYIKKSYPEIWDFEFLKIHNCIITSSVIVEKKLIDKLGGFRPIPDGVEDYDCWLGLLRHTSLIYIDYPLFYYDGQHGLGRNY
tara:strand:- start:1689 stop:2396 length:708 start_codon:yes stop_codon:yes gene_type:complete